jgi:tetratricopeptide (TPR) repeat protein
VKNITHTGFADPAKQGDKVERNLRLLRQELADRPDDPFILYNLGAVALTQGQTAEALELLERSLKGLYPGDTLEHKLYVLLIRGNQELGRRDKALEVCRAGRELYPHDPELLFWEGILHREQGNLAGAEGCFLRVLQAPRGQAFTSVDAGLQGYRARHLLAEVYRQQGRRAEAEAQWRAAIGECPAFPAAWLNLAELFLEQNRWEELEQAARQLEADPRHVTEGLVLRARGLLARKELDPARGLLAEAIARDHRALWPRVILSHVFLQEGKDWDAAEQALRDVLTLDPNHAQARHNLNVLLHQQGRGPAAPASDGEAAVQPTKVVAAPGRGGPRCSLCMIVRNEEANLPACLGTVADLVDEIVIVDTGSTDGTKEAARRFGAKVIDFTWVDSFAAARNESLRHATGQWVLWLDADDRLDEDNRARLRNLLAGVTDENAAYVMKCLCLPDPVTETVTAVDHVRLFRRHPELRWEYRVHEQILPALHRLGYEIRWSDVAVRHTGYQDPELRRRKLERDLRLLRLEDAECPDHPFTLFNLGSVYQELGRLDEAVGLFRRSLARSQPADSIVRKLYALTAQCLRQLGKKEEALAACREGRRLYPEDVELLFQEGLVRRELGDPRGAEACLVRLLNAKDADHYASEDTGLAGFKARYNLGILYHDLGQVPAAEAQWRAAAAEQPGFLPAWLGLGEVCLSQARWGELDVVARALAAARPHDPAAELEAGLLRARGHMARREFPAARRLLEATVARFPGEVRPRIVLSHALLQEGRDWAAAEQALRDVLALDPTQAETRHNLEVLLRQQARDPAAAPAPLRLAVVCVVHNEEDFIEPFLEHYFGRGADTVFLVNNDCTDETLALARRYPNVVIAEMDSNGELDDFLMTEMYQRYRAACAGRYDYAFLVACDEFIVPKERHLLKDALEPYRALPVLGTEGYEVVQAPDEPPLDPAAPPLLQRRWGLANPLYNKPVVLRPDGPERLVVGHHQLEGPVPYPPHAPFYLFHLAACDERIFLKRRLKMARRQGARNAARGYSVQYTNKSEADVRRLWQELQHHPRTRPLPIPPGRTTTA